MANTRRPNIVFILSDDQGPWAFGPAGNEEIRTPSLDRLAEQGMRFDNFFCASPVCSPARASLLTGRIPSQHGVHDWIRAGSIPQEPENGGEIVEYLEGLAGYTDLLADVGYHCALSGKWHLGNSLSPQKSFTRWNVHGKGGGPYYGAPMVVDGRQYTEERYVTDAITDNALGFLDELAAEEAPFYLGVHYTAPHSPWDREQHPEELFRSYYDSCPFRSVPDEPLHPWQNASAPIGTTPKRRRELLSGYYAAVTAMDAGIGRILDRVDALGIREDTFVFFTSDNGMNMGHHGIWGKGNGTFPQNMYDTSVKIPTLASMPGTIQAGSRCSDLLSQYDFMPTLLDLVGTQNPDAEALPGRSFAGLLKGISDEDRENVVVFDEYGPVRMIRTREWKYVRRYPYGPDELYHLEKDPEERRNLVEEASSTATVKQLRAQLERWFLAYADQRVTGVREPVTGKGQIRRCGAYAEGAPAFEQDFGYANLSGADTRAAYAPFRGWPPQ
jgi:arylsulfatase A-like enzyme